jgi:hypothetical protein
MKMFFAHVGIDGGFSQADAGHCPLLDFGNWLDVHVET